LQELVQKHTERFTIHKIVLILGLFNDFLSIVWFVSIVIIITIQVFQICKLVSGFSLLLFSDLYIVLLF